MAKSCVHSSGEVLLEEFLIRWESPERACPRDRSAATPDQRDLLGKRAVTADTALRLATFSARLKDSGWDCRLTTTSKSTSRIGKELLRVEQARAEYVFSAADA